MKYGLKLSAIEQVKHVFAGHPEIEQVILYGSRAKGTHDDGSDIDLCMRGERLTLPLQLKIENELDDLLLPLKIDLSVFHQLDNPDLIDHINRVGVEFYRRPSGK